MERGPDTRAAHSLAARIRHGFVLDLGRSERFVGRVAIASVIVAGLFALQRALLPGDHIDALWISMIAATVVTALLAGFIASVITAFVAAFLIDVLLLEPRGSILLSSTQDAFTLALFLAVSIIGSAAVSRPWRHLPDAQLAVPLPARLRLPLLDPLTDREREILVMLSRGMSNREIARRLVVSQNTVKSHLEHLYGKLDVPSRGRAVAEGRRLGLLVEGDD